MRSTKTVIVAILAVLMTLSYVEEELDSGLA